jgi:2-polyprenyl-3-methyl-5-hydroxy-6-metoxy-1,4-benzoquinol methylase
VINEIERDFDRLALFDQSGWNGNNHYHNFLLRSVPPNCERVLEIGCGTGALSRRLAQRAEHVTAIDLSSQMIRVARSRSAHFPNIKFEIDDIMTRQLPESEFDCIASIATLHHVPARAVLLKIRDALKPGGGLIVLDLVEPERNLLTANGVADSILNVVAMGASCSLRLFHNGRLRPPREVRAAWAEHGKTDRYLTMDEVRSLYGSLFPGVQIRRHLLWRYSAIWIKS